MANNSIKVTDRLSETTDGFYEAVLNNGGRKSFWPDTWDEFRVVDELKNAFGNKKYVPRPNSNNTYEGFTTGGQKIWMFIDTNGSIISAFPVL